MGGTAKHFWDKECATAKLWQHIGADWYLEHDFKFIKRKYCDSTFLAFSVNICQAPSIAIILPSETAIAEWPKHNKIWSEHRFVQIN